MIVGALILADAGPILRLGSDGTRWKLLDHGGIRLLGVGPLLLFEGDVGESKLKLGTELGFRQISFYPVSLDSARIQDEDRRSPGDIETMKPGGVFLYMCLDGHEIGGDECGNLIIRV